MQQLGIRNDDLFATQGFPELRWVYADSHHVGEAVLRAMHIEYRRVQSNPSLPTLFTHGLAAYSRQHRLPLSQCLSKSTLQNFGTVIIFDALI
jgi:hypothetical protein